MKHLAHGRVVGEHAAIPFDHVKSQHVLLICAEANSDLRGNVSREHDVTGPCISQSNVTVCPVPASKSFPERTSCVAKPSCSHGGAGGAALQRQISAISRISPSPDRSPSRSSWIRTSVTKISNRAATSSAAAGLGVASDVTSRIAMNASVDAANGMAELCCSRGVVVGWRRAR